MDIQIDNRQNQFPLDETNLRKAAQAILNDLEYPEAELSIVLVDDTEIHDLNRQYLNHDRPTNVISFPMQEGEFTEINPNLLGDVVISVDTADREAREAALPMETRLMELLVHGILHLVGYDHESPKADAEAMERKTEELMEKFGDWLGPKKADSTP